MKKTAFRAAAVAALVTPALLLGPAADAASLARPDKKGDAPKAIDMTSVRYVNGPKKASFTLKFRALKLNKVGAVFGEMAPNNKRLIPHYVAFFQRTKAGGKFKAKMLIRKPGSTKTAKCKGMRLKTGKNKLVITVPQKCYGKHAGTLRFAAGVGSITGKSDASGKKVSNPVKRG